MSDAKVLTTAEVEALPEHGDEDGGMPGVVLVDRDELLATTRALETAEMRIARARLDDCEDELCACCLGRDEALERAERAETERDAARRELAELVAALEKKKYALTGGVMSLSGAFNAGIDTAIEAAMAKAERAKPSDWPCLDCQPESPAKAGLKTLVAELVTALAGLERRFLGPTASDPGGPCWCSEDRPRWLGHEDCCDVARDALAKAKGATP